jgi:hypothetical protein
MHLLRSHQRVGGSWRGGACRKVRKRHFLRHLYIKVIILPRQARDKHRENSKKGRFLEGEQLLDTYGVATANILLLIQYGFAADRNPVGSAKLLDLPQKPAPQWLRPPPAAAADDANNGAAKDADADGDQQRQQRQQQQVQGHPDLAPALLRCGELLQSAHSRPKSGDHLYHTRTRLDAGAGGAK